MPPHTAFRHLFLIFASGLFLAGCGGGSDAPATYPTVAASRVDDHGPIFRSLAVTLSAPGGVEVEYWADGASRLVVASASATSLAHDVVLPRLHARSSYAYEVHSTVAGGRSAALATGSFSTADLPADVKAMTFAASGSATTPLTFLAIRSAFTGGVVIDAAGEVVWYGRTSVSPQGATRRVNGDWVVVEDGLTEFSALGETVGHLAQSRMPAGATIHHSVTATPQNTLLFFALEPRAFGAQVLNGESVWEWNPADDSLRKRWSAFDFLDPAVDFSARSLPTDWFHANSIAMGPGGNVIVSFHFLDQILSLAPDLASIQWRLGGPGSVYAIGADQATSGQHSAREVAPNDILVFDNGFARADGSKYSRALELKLDPVTHTASTLWEYRPSPDIWASIISSVRRMANGNSVVMFGTPPGLVGATGPVAIHEVSPAGALLWKVIVTLPGGSIFQGDPMRSIGGESTVN